MTKTQSPDNTGGVEDREDDRRDAELDEQQNLNQGSDTGTHSSTRSGVNWGRSYRGKLVPNTQTAQGKNVVGNAVLNLSYSRDEIARRAYALYLKRGCEHGRDIDDWVQATKELAEPLGKSEEKAGREDIYSC